MRRVVNIKKYTLSETLRLYPAVPFNVRLALRDTTLPTVSVSNNDQPIGILKNDTIAYSTLTLQRRPDIYPVIGHSASTFSPERWETWKPESWQYLSFNGGPRLCMGQDFALSEIKFTVVKLLQKIERVEARLPRQDQYMKCDIVLQPGAGVQVALFSSP